MKYIIYLLIVISFLNCGLYSEISQRNLEKSNSAEIGQVIAHPSNLYTVQVTESGFYYDFNKVGDNSLQLTPKDMLAYLAGSYYIIPIPIENISNSDAQPTAQNFRTFVNNFFDIRMKRKSEILALRDTTISGIPGVYFEMFVPGDIEITKNPGGGTNYNIYMNHFCYSGVFLKGNENFMWITKSDPIMVNKYEEQNMRFDIRTKENALKFIALVKFNRSF